MNTSTAVRVLGLVGWMIAAGCSSSDSGAPASASGPMTADQWCAQGPGQLCNARKACCDSGAIGWDATQCETTEKSNCTAGAAMVQTGKRAFDPAKAKACVAATQAASSKCIIGTADYELLATLKQACTAVFAGAVPAGGACDSSADCAAAAANIGMCEAGQCSSRPLTADGDACLGSTAACDSGFYCDTWTSPGSKTCRALVGAGQPCPHLVECAPTAYCDTSSQTCAQPLEGGKPCSSNTQCQSYDCARNAQCAAIGPYLGKKECGVQ